MRARFKGFGGRKNSNGQTAVDHQTVNVHPRVILGPARGCGRSKFARRGQEKSFKKLRGHADLKTLFNGLRPNLQPFKKAASSP
jgi:hypothetical protein